MASWHSRNLQETYKELEATENGLTTAEVHKRLQKYGKNVLEEEEKSSAFLLFISQFKSALVIVLIAATLISLAIGHFVDASVIGAIVVLNSVFGFIQEYKAEKSMQALKRMSAPTATVLRGGRQFRIPAAELVPGDIIMLASGDKVPADARLIEAVNLRVDQAALTGESHPINKDASTLSEHKILAARSNMLFAATTVTYGHCTAIVVETGMQTAIGKIATIVVTTGEEKTPLQKKLASTAKYIGIGVIAIAVVIFGAGLLRGISLFDMFLNAIALAVAAVPEGLPAIVTITLSIGLKTMASKKAVVRKLPVTETLGSTTVICTDKTGTLTKNEMTVTRLYADGKTIDVTGSGYEPKGRFLHRNTKFDIRKNQVASKLLEVASLCNLATLEKERGKWDIIGDPTEGALIVAAEKAKLDARRLYKKIGEISFSSERKMMTTVHKSNRFCFAAVKGAPSVVLSHCTKIYVGGKVRALTKKDKATILQAKQSMTSEALRVLAFAYRPLKTSETKKIGTTHTEKDLIFIGLAGMIDPARPEVHRAIALCKQAGIKVVMVTGDDKDTALAIAKEIGLYGGGQIMLGSAFSRISDRELTKIIEDVDIFARVSPEHKCRIVDALRKRGHVIAMTGDGVNDAPALKKADIGVAMGIKGTDVSKEASDMVLEDDNFATIVNAVEEGRKIYDNIKKFIRYLLSCNLGEVLVIFIAALIGLPLPLIAVQILLMNLLTDGLPALALGVDPAEKDAMNRKPRSPKEHIIGWPMIRTITIVGAVMCLGVLGLFKWALASGASIESARSVAFTGIVAFQLFNVFNARSDKKSILHSGFPSGWLFAAVASSVLLQLAVVYFPVLQRLFGTASLSLAWLGWIVLMAASILVVIEVQKGVLRLVNRDHA